MALIIFDFDGTIADILPHIKKEYNIVADRFSLRKIENLDEVRKLTIDQFFRQYHIPWYRVPQLLKIAIDKQSEIMPKVKPHKGMKTLLKDLAKHHDLGILSTNKEKNIQAFLDMNDLNIFRFIKTVPKIFGKNIQLKKIKKDYDSVYYIGDEVRDIKAAKNAAVTSIAVTWGLNSLEILQKFKPDHIITKATDLPVLLDQ